MKTKNRKKSLENVYVNVSVNVNRNFIDREWKMSEQVYFVASFPRD